MRKKGKFIIKTFDDLEKMSRLEIDNHRFEYISHGLFKNNDSNRQYLFEIELYKEIRFKQDTYDRFDRWIKQYKSNPKENIVLSLIVKITSKDDGKDLLYFAGIQSQLKKIKEFKFIKGIKIEIPDKYKNL